MKYIKVGIIGTGGIAGLYQSRNEDSNLTHIKSLLSFKNIKIIGIADNNISNLNKFSKRWSIKKLYTNYKNLLNNHEIDILFIATPIDTHLDILKALNKYKIKKIFCEKPFLLKSNDFLKIKPVIKNNIILINYFRRWNKDLQNLKKNIAKQKYGKINKVNFYYTKSLLNTGLHMVDICLFFFGEPNKIKTIKKYNLNNSKQTAYDFIFQYTLFDVYFNHIPNTKYAFFETKIFFSKFLISLTDRLRIINIYKSKIDQDYKFIKKSYLFKKINTRWKDCIDNAIKELINANNINTIEHNQKHNLILTKMYEKIKKN